MVDLYIYYIALVLSLRTYVGLELSLAGCLVLEWMTCLFSVYLSLNEWVFSTLTFPCYFIVTYFPTTKVKSLVPCEGKTPPSHISRLTSTSFPSSRYRATSPLHHRLSRCHSHVSSPSHSTRHADHRTQSPRKTTSHRNPSPRTISDLDSGCLHSRVMCDVSRY